MREDCLRYSRPMCSFAASGEKQNSLGKHLTVCCAVFHRHELWMSVNTFEKNCKLRETYLPKLKSWARAHLVTVKFLFVRLDGPTLWGARWNDAAVTDETAPSDGLIKERRFKNVEKCNESSSGWQEDWNERQRSNCPLATCPVTSSWLVLSLRHWNTPFRIVAST